MSEWQIRLRQSVRWPLSRGIELHGSIYVAASASTTSAAESKWSCVRRVGHGSSPPHRQRSALTPTANVPGGGGGSACAGKKSSQRPSRTCSVCGQKRRSVVVAAAAQQKARCSRSPSASVGPCPSATSPTKQPPLVPAIRRTVTPCLLST